MHLHLSYRSWQEVSPLSCDGLLKKGPRRPCSRWWRRCSWWLSRWIIISSATSSPLLDGPVSRLSPLWSRPLSQAGDFYRLCSTKVIHYRPVLLLQSPPYTPDQRRGIRTADGTSQRCPPGVSGVQGEDGRGGRGGNSSPWSSSVTDHRIGQHAARQ